MDAFINALLDIVIERLIGIPGWRTVVVAPLWNISLWMLTRPYGLVKALVFLGGLMGVLSRANILLAKVAIPGWLAHSRLPLWGRDLLNRGGRIVSVVCTTALWLTTAAIVLQLCDYSASEHDALIKYTWPAFECVRDLLPADELVWGMQLGEHHPIAAFVTTLGGAVIGGMLIQSTGWPLRLLAWIESSRTESDVKKDWRFEGLISLLEEIASIMQLPYAPDIEAFETDRDQGWKIDLIQVVNGPPLLWATVMALSPTGGLFTLSAFALTALAIDAITLALRPGLNQWYVLQLLHKMTKAAEDGQWEEVKQCSQMLLKLQPENPEIVAGIALARAAMSGASYGEREAWPLLERAVRMPISVAQMRRVVALINKFVVWLHSVSPAPFDDRMAQRIVELAEHRENLPRKDRMLLAIAVKKLRREASIHGIAQESVERLWQSYRSYLPRHPGAVLVPEISQVFPPATYRLSRTIAAAIRAKPQTSGLYIGLTTIAMLLAFISLRSARVAVIKLPGPATTSNIQWRPVPSIYAPARRKELLHTKWGLPRPGVGQLAIRNNGRSYLVSIGESLDAWAAAFDAVKRGPTGHRLFYMKPGVSLELHPVQWRLQRIALQAEVYAPRRQVACAKIIGPSVFVGGVRVGDPLSVAVQSFGRSSFFEKPRSNWPPLRRISWCGSSKQGCWIEADFRPAPPFQIVVLWVHSQGMACWDKKIWVPAWNDEAIPDFAKVRDAF